MDTLTPRSVVFVCTGNICRSPMAATVFRELVLRAACADRFAIESAALRPHHTGRPADPRAVAAAERRGYSWLPSCARPIAAQDFEDSLVVGMGAWHTERLRRIQPEGCEPVRSLADYVEGRPVSEIADPFHQDEAAFERALDLIEVGCAGLLRELRS